MTEDQREFMVLVGKYSEKLDETPWWNFIKKRYYRRMMESALECIGRFP